MGTGFQEHDKQDGGQKEIIHFHIMSESLALLNINKAQTKSLMHRRQTIASRTLEG